MLNHSGNDIAQGKSTLMASGHCDCYLEGIDRYTCIYNMCVMFIDLNFWISFGLLL